MYISNVQFEFVLVLTFLRHYEFPHFILFYYFFPKSSFLLSFVALCLSLFSHERKKDYYLFIVFAWMGIDNVIRGLTSDPILCFCFWQIFCGCTCMAYMHNVTYCLMTNSYCIFRVCLSSISESNLICNVSVKVNEIKPKRNQITREKSTKL